MTWHDHNRSMWRQNHWDVFRSLAAEGDRERLERLLIPLRGHHAELLVEKAEGDRREFSAMLNRTVEEYEDALRAMFGATRTLAQVLALPCGWCGEQSCADREEHRRLNAARETSWREPTDSGSDSREPADGLSSPPAAGQGVVGPSAEGDGPAAPTGDRCRHTITLPDGETRHCRLPSMHVSFCAYDGLSRLTGGPS